MWEPAAQGEVTRWDQVNSKWPKGPLKLFGPGADSGTFDYFTEAVNGKAKSSRGDFTASEDDNVLVQGVEADVNALAYFGYAYYAAQQGKMKALKVVNSKGEAVGPSRSRGARWHLQPVLASAVHLRQRAERPATARSRSSSSST